MLFLYVTLFTYNRKRRGKIIITFAIYAYILYD